MEDTITNIRNRLKDMGLNSEFMLRCNGDDDWEATASNLNNAVPLGEVDGEFYARADTAGEAVGRLWNSVVAWSAWKFQQRDVE